MFTKAFWKATFERAVKTFGQTALTAVGADQLNVLHADWQTILGLGGGGFVLSVLTSLASAKVGAAGPSLANEVTAPPARNRDPKTGRWTSTHRKES